MPDEAAAPVSDARPSALLAAVLGWVWPGLGHLHVGRPWKALFYCTVVCGAYALGLWLSAGLCVNAQRDPIWFAAQALAGGPTALAAWWTHGWTPTARIPTYDVGLLYVTVAALLNVVAISDALGVVHERRALPEAPPPPPRPDPDAGPLDALP